MAAEDKETSTIALGVQGIRHSPDGLRAIIGNAPAIKQTMDNPLPFLDMNPTTISYDRLLEVLAEQNRVGGVTDLLGHVRVMPSSPERISLTPAGKDAIEE